MSMKEPQRKAYRTMQGREIDFDQLRLKNEMTLAVGNARVTLGATKLVLVAKLFANVKIL